MTKFETVGVNLQYNARNTQEANKAFKYSCDCCCNKGMKLECDRCAIAYAHSMVCACFSDQEQKGNERNE